jgi:uncharacterized membrane protein
MFEMLSSLWDVLLSLTIWTFIFCIYGFIGALFGAWIGSRKRHDSDNLTWILLGIVIFTGGLFPLTYYLVYAG